MSIAFLLDAFANNQEKEAIIWKDKVYHYHWLLNQIEYWKQQIKKNSIPSGAVATIEADFSPNAIALFLALANHAGISVPLTSSVESKKTELSEIAQGEFSFIINENDEVEVRKLPYSAHHEFYQKLRSMHHPGLVLFSSGSTGKCKAAVHDFSTILERFKVPGSSLRSITFLLYDHIGGINTMLYNLANGGCLVTVQNRTPDEVLKAVAKYHVELLPTSPTFINLVLLSEAYKRHGLNSLKTVSYGTEPMPEITLKRFHELFPQIKLLQTYGLSELGILRSKSKNPDSLWVKVGGKGFATRVVNGILQIKAKSAMLGYLNAPSPFTDDGWFHTDDAVETDGEYIKILGRTSEIINVGGEKVYPAEVENVIQEMKGVTEVLVYGERNPITGNIVCAKIGLFDDEDKKIFPAKLKKFCREKLEAYKVPVKIKIIDEKQHSDRFKKVRVANQNDVALL